MFTQEEIASFNELETSLCTYIVVKIDKVVYMPIRERLHRRKSHHSMNSNRLYITISQAIWTRWPTCGFASLPTPPMCPLPQSCVSAEKSAAKDSLNSKSGSKCSLKRKRRQGHRM